MQVVGFPDLQYLVKFRTRFFRQVVGVTMGTNCAPLLAHLFLRACKSDFFTTLV